MIPIFISIFMTSFIIKEGIAFSQMSLNDIESIFFWKNTTFNDGMFYSLMGKDAGDEKMQRLDEILTEVRILSEKYNKFTSDMKQKQDDRWKLRINQRQDTEFLTFVKSRLSININIVDYMHKETINFKAERQSFDRKMMTGTKFLLQYLNEESNALDQIYQLIFPSFTHIMPNFLQLIYVDAEKNIPYECDQYTTAQQFVYFTYITLIITEMKGFSTLVYIASMLQHTSQLNEYVTEIETAEKKFTKRVTDYYERIYKAMISIPREIHRCEVDPPKRGENFLELINYQQVKLFNAGPLGLTSKHEEIYCNLGCEYINHNVMEKMMEVQIDDCHTLGMVQDIQSCPARPGSSREYLWWRKFDNTYGHYASCPTAVQMGNGRVPYSDRCFLCQCAVIPQSDKSYKNSILRISVTSQISDIENNMIVVGVRFVIHKKVLHLQIQQSKFVLNEINDNSSVWKNLDDHRSTPGVSEIQSEMLSSFSGQLYLDDVMLPPKYAVTGVRFLSRHNYPEGFYLQVHGTPFDLKTGKLIPEDAVWFIAHPDLSIRSDYDRDRILINTEELDDPTRCTEYNYDRTANNFIKFRHSSVSKDGGQSTIPFIDAQPVETYPPFPLSGIGLFYRNKVGCGGYITPRIFTIDMSQYN